MVYEMTGQQLNRATAVDGSTGPGDGRVVGLDFTLLSNLYTGTGGMRNFGTGQIFN